MSARRVNVWGPQDFRQDRCHKKKMNKITPMAEKHADKRNSQESLTDRGASPFAGRGDPRLRDLYARSQWRGYQLECGRPAVQGLPAPRRSSARPSRAFTPRRTRSPDCRRAHWKSRRAKANSRPKAGACARTARASGPMSSSIPSALPTGELMGFAKITRDLTERREAQRALEQTRDALLQSQKMDAIGQLTGGVAHDFNNLLMAILSSHQLLRKRLGDDPRLLLLLDNATQAAQRGVALTQRMLAFARRQELKAEPVDVPTLIASMMELLRRSLGPSISIETELPCLSRSRPGRSHAARTGHPQPFAQCPGRDAQRAARWGSRHGPRPWAKATRRACRPAVTSASPCATPARAWTMQRWRARSNLSSPPRAWARERALAFPWSMASPSNWAAS